MRSARRFLTVGVAVLLLLGIVMVGLAVVAATALPLVVAVGVAVLGLVVGLGTRTTRRSESRRWRASPTTERDDEPGDITSPHDGAEPEWVTQWESGPPASAVPFVRDRLATVLSAWDLAPEVREDIFLVVTELVSNAVEHAQSPVRLIVRLAGNTVRVEVRDAAPEPPRLQSHDPWRNRGRGLQMVEALSAQWGWANQPVGKVVWAEVLTR